jgi:hypothetical protein
MGHFDAHRGPYAYLKTPYGYDTMWDSSNDLDRVDDYYYYLENK